MRKNHVFRRKDMERMNSSQQTGVFVIKTEVEEEDEDHHREAPLPAAASKLVVNKAPRPSRGLVPLRSLEKSIKLGETFHSFGEVSQAITLYEMRQKVRLTQKYFRRIAANPKPSNKEDYMLTVEERKRFVYRWVDFCCTYFDDLLARTDPEGANDGGNTQVLGLAMKECPMRIRFQLRFNEKDLMISIFKEEHDHTHPNNNTSDPPQVTSEPKNNAGSATISTPTVNLNNISDQSNPKRVRKEPPSLAPISSLKNLATSAVETSFPDSDSNSHYSPLILRRQLNSKLNSNLPIPKPPPLKAMPLLSCNNEFVVPHQPDNVLSPENIIRNIYLNLCRLHATGVSPGASGLSFATQNPDLIKITSDLSGVDTAEVSAICRPKSLMNMITRPEESAYRATTAVPEATCSNTRPVKGNGEMIQMGAQRPATYNEKSVNTEAFTPPVRRQSDNSVNTDTNDYIDLPVEVIIKSEPPDGLIEYFDENASSSDINLNDDYMSNDRIDDPR